MTTVLHSVGRIWLEQTLTWLYNQIRFLPDDIENHIACECTRNLDQFALPNIHALADEPLPRRLLDRVQFKAHLRRGPVSGLVKRVARKTGSRVLHSHFGRNGWWNVPVARQLGLRHVVTFYGYDVNQLPKTDPVWRERYKELFDNVEKVLCEGPHMGKDILALGCPAEKIQVHALGVDLEKIPFQPRTVARGEPLRFLIAAAFREKKGLPYAIHALGKFAESHPKIEITVIGDAGKQPGSREEKDRILAAIEAHGLAPKTRLLGFQKHDRLIAEAYKHHIFVSPSVTAADGDTEGGAPVAIIEMAASGMPVLSTTHCDIPNVLGEKNRALLAPERDADALCERLLSLKPASFESIAKDNRNYIEAEFSCDRQAAKLAGIYREPG